MTNDLTELRKIAEAATEGDWTVGTDGASENVYADWETEHGDYAKRVVKVGNLPDARHIAAFDPPTVLELIARVKSSEAKVAAGLDVAEWVRDNHGDYISREIEERLREALDGTP